MRTAFANRRAPAVPATREFDGAAGVFAPCRLRSRIALVALLTSADDKTHATGR